jgi:hypothetical protein
MKKTIYLINGDIGCGSLVSWADTEPDIAVTPRAASCPETFHEPGTVPLDPRMPVTAYVIERR